MARIQMTEALARAAAQDAGNRHMRQFGRKKWNGDDFMVAVAEFDRLWPRPDMVAELLAREGIKPKAHPAR